MHHQPFASNLQVLDAIHSIGESSDYLIWTCPWAMQLSGFSSSNSGANEATRDPQDEMAVHVPYLAVIKLLAFKLF